MKFIQMHLYFFICFTCSSLCIFLLVMFIMTFYPNCSGIAEDKAAGKMWDNYWKDIDGDPFIMLPADIPDLATWGHDESILEQIHSKT